MARVKWYRTRECAPPHVITHPEKVHQLAVEFVTEGWDRTQPALIGYQQGGHIQLLSGSHRHAAAVVAGITIPVIVWPRALVQRAWGNVEMWQELMQMGEEDYAYAQDE